MKKENIFLDLSKLSEEQQRKVIALLPKAEFDDQYEITSEHFKLCFADEWWVINDMFDLKDKQELTYDQFLEMMGGESKEVLQVENNGWIKIEGIANEIKASGDLWVVTKNGEIEFLQELEYLPIGYATHYQPIIKPSPPKY